MGNGSVVYRVVLIEFGKGRKSEFGRVTISIWTRFTERRDRQEVTIESHPKWLFVPLSFETPGSERPLRDSRQTTTLNIPPHPTPPLRSDVSLV